MPQGYALVEYEAKKSAEQAISEMNGKELLGKPVRTPAPPMPITYGGLEPSCAPHLQVKVDWAFTHGPIRKLRK